MLVASPTGPAPHGRLLDALAKVMTFTLEVFCANSVKKRICTAVERKYKDGENFGVVERDQLHP